MNATVLVGIIVTAEQAFAGIVQLVNAIKGDFSTSDQATVNAQLNQSVTNLKAAVATLDQDAAG